MDNKLELIDYTLIESINKYYKILENTGYVRQSNVDNLLVLSFISEIIKEFPYLNERDYNNLFKVWDCVASNTCFIPFAEYSKYIGKRITGNTSMRIRIMDDNTRVANNQIRITQL